MDREIDPVLDYPGTPPSQVNEIVSDAVFKSQGYKKQVKMNLYSYV